MRLTLLGNMHVDTLKEGSRQPSFLETDKRGVIIKERCNDTCAQEALEFAR